MKLKINFSKLSYYFLRTFYKLLTNIKLIEFYLKLNNLFHNTKALK